MATKWDGRNEISTNNGISGENGNYRSGDGAATVKQRWAEFRSTRRSMMSGVSGKPVDDTERRRRCEVRVFY